MFLCDAPTDYVIGLKGQVMFDFGTTAPWDGRPALVTPSAFLNVAPSRANGRAAVGAVFVD